MSSWRKGRIWLAVLVLSGLSVTSVASADTVVGRWCDKPLSSLPDLNCIIEIVITDDGEVEMRSSYGDGSSSVQKLEEQSGQMYVAVDNKFGEKYRIVAESGDLQLLNYDGLIRVARRLEDTPQLRECGWDADE